jgi:glycerophosphoryl diester phosphodiesterase
MCKRCAFIGCALIALGLVTAGRPSGGKSDPLLIAHRGLLREAPENTFAAFGACMDLRLGFELDIRRTKDGHLVCVHDETVKRTTNGTGRIADLTLAELRKLDAGAWFSSAFAGEKVPTLDEVFALLAQRKAGHSLVALDLKIDDAAVETEIVRLAEKHGVLDQMLCIGLAISAPAVRRQYRAASPKIAIAFLANSPGDLPAAMSDKDADWLYIRFVPSAEQVSKMHGAGKRVILVGPLVAGNEPDNWGRARQAGVDAILTDYPLECRRSWRPNTK